jgi:hypothetical protein
MCSLHVKIPACPPITYNRRVPGKHSIKKMSQKKSRSIMIWGQIVRSVTSVKDPNRLRITGFFEFFPSSGILGTRKHDVSGPVWGPSQGPVIEVSSV